MYEAAIDRQMNRTLAQFQRNYRPQGPNVRAMTPKEHEVFIGTTVDQFESCVRTSDRSDNKASDRDPSPAKIRTRDREVRQGVGSDTEFLNTSSGEYDSSRRSWTLDTREGWRVMEPGGESQSKRNVVAGKMSAGHLYGIEMQRHGDVIRMLQYDVDLNNPSNSVISEMPQQWVRSESAFIA